VLTGENLQQLTPGTYWHISAANGKADFHEKAASVASRNNSAAGSTATSASFGTEQIPARVAKAKVENSFMPHRPTIEASAPQALSFSSPSQSGIHQNESGWAAPEACESPSLLVVAFSVFGSHVGARTCGC
jgi:hypothetical protein